MNRFHPHSRVSAPTLVGLKGRGDQRRAEAERFIHACFARAYGADVRHYLPILERDLRELWRGAMRVAREQR